MQRRRRRSQRFWFLSMSFDTVATHVNRQGSAGRPSRTFPVYGFTPQHSPSFERCFIDDLILRSRPRKSRPPSGTPTSRTNWAISRSLLHGDRDAPGSVACCRSGRPFDCRACGSAETKLSAIESQAELDEIQAALSGPARHHSFRTGRGLLGRLSWCDGACGKAGRVGRGKAEGSREGLRVHSTRPDSDRSCNAQSDNGGTGASRRANTARRAVALHYRGSDAEESRNGKACRS